MDWALRTTLLVLLILLIRCSLFCVSGSVQFMNVFEVEMNARSRRWQTIWKLFAINFKLACDSIIFTFSATNVAHTQARGRRTAILQFFHGQVNLSFPLFRSSRSVNLLPSDAKETERARQRNKVLMCSRAHNSEISLPKLSIIILPWSRTHTHIVARHPVDQRRR